MYTTKRALKVINNEYNYSTLYIIHKSLTFYDILKMNTMKFMFRDRNKLLPFKLKKLYSFIFNNTYIFHKLKVRTNIKDFYLSNTGPKLWNNLDN